MERVIEHFHIWRRQVNEATELSQVIERYLDTFLSLARTDRGIIYLKNIERWAGRGIDLQQQKYRSLLIPTAQTGERMLVHAPDSMLPEPWIKAFMVIPLQAGGDPIGAVYVDWIQSQYDDQLGRQLSEFVWLTSALLENTLLHEQIAPHRAHKRQNSHPFNEIIGESPAMKSVFNSLSRVVDSDAAVLILGESGTGKELIARAIHMHSPRRHKPFIAIDCGAIPQDLLESELFGYKKGTFTGANTDKVGLFESANEGTVFLDEITNTSPALQAKLLRALQEKSIRRLGENIVRAIDVRFISATNRDLKSEVEAGHFRKDVYFRLNVISIELPPLRERGEDIPLLVEFFIEQISSRLHLPPKKINAAVMEKLQAYPWPGNIRELENVVEQLLVLAPDEVVQISDLPERFLEQHHAQVVGYSLYDHEKALIQKVLDKTNWNIKQSAKMLDISRTTLYSKIEKHNLDLEGQRRKTGEE